MLSFLKKTALCLLLAAAGSSCHPATTAAPTGTFTYVRYVVALPGQPNTVFDRVGGTLTLNPDGTYDKQLTFTNAVGTMNPKDHGTYKVSGDNITFDFPDRHDGLPHTYGGTFRYLPAAKALTLHLNETSDGSYEQVGLVQQGTEAQARNFPDDGSATLAQ